MGEPEETMCSAKVRVRTKTEKLCIAAREFRKSAVSWIQQWMIQVEAAELLCESGDSDDTLSPRPVYNEDEIIRQMADSQSSDDIMAVKSILVSPSASPKMSVCPITVLSDSEL